jgi:hypothetical protein
MYFRRPATRSDEPPPPLREFRGLFVTTAWNLDWPSRPGLHWRVQADEIHAIVRRAKELNCNVIILQVRAFGDRIYRNTSIQPSEPWAAALNNSHDPDGSANPAYDPLATWVRAAHEAGLELHAWVSPFRVNTLIATERDREGKPMYLPVIATQDGNHLYLDPRSMRVQAYVLQVIRDVIQAGRGVPILRAVGAGPTIKAAGGDDVDGIMCTHDLTDAWKAAATTPTLRSVSAGPKRNARISWLLKKAGQPPAGPPATLDGFVELLFAQISRQPGLKLGLSPMSDDKNAMMWLRNGKVNYIVPELYFKRGGGQFKPRLEAWLDMVQPGRDFTPIVVAGLFTQRTQSPEHGANETWLAGEIVDQIADARSARGSRSRVAASGQAHYSWFSLRSPEHGGPEAANNIGNRLRDEIGLYGRPALVPCCTTVPREAAAPAPPNVTWTSGHRVRWGTEGRGVKVCRWAVWTRDDHGWSEMRILGPNTTELSVPAGVDRVAVKAIDQYNRESPCGIAR